MQDSEEVFFKPVSTLLSHHGVVDGPREVRLWRKRLGRHTADNVGQSRVQFDEVIVALFDGYRTEREAEENVIDCVWLPR